MRLAQTPEEVRPGRSAGWAALVALLAPALVYVGLPEATPEDVERFVTLATAAASAITALVTWVAGFVRRDNAAAVVALLMLSTGASAQTAPYAAGSLAWPSDSLAWERGYLGGDFDRYPYRAGEAFDWVGYAGDAVHEGLQFSTEFGSCARGRGYFGPYGVSSTVFVPGPDGSRMIPADVLTAESEAGPCFGAVRIGEGPSALTVWAESPEDPTVRGAPTGEPIVFTVYRPAPGTSTNHLGEPTNYRPLYRVPVEPVLYEPDAILGTIETADSLLALVDSLETYIEAVEGIVAGRDSLVSALAEAEAERDAAESARQAAETAKNAAFAERDQALAARDVAITERDDALAMLGTVEAERDVALEQLAEAEAAVALAITRLNQFLALFASLFGP